MKVVLRTSLGTRDAGALGLNHEECTDGAEITVADDTGEELIARGLAESTGKPAKPKKLEAVPDKPMISKAKETTTKTDV